MKVALLVNARAGRIRREADLERRLVAAAGGAKAYTTQTVAELGQVAADLAQWAPEVVVLCGGDGSVMEGVTALERAFGASPLPALVFAPAGTAATIGRRFAQPRDPVLAVRRIVQAEGIETVVTPTLDVRGGDERRVGFIFGTGLVARFFERYEEAGAPGYAGAARIALGLVGGAMLRTQFARSVLDPMPCRVTVDGRQLEADAFSLVIASVIRDVGLGIRITHRAAEDPRRPHVVAMWLPAPRLVRHVPSVLAGRPLRGDGVFDALASELVVEMPSGGGAYVLDGDLLRASRVVVRAGPRVKVVRFRD